MTKFLNKSRVLIIVFAIMLLAVGCNKAVPAGNQPAAQNPDQSQTQAPAPKEYSYNGLEGQDALSLLKLLYTVETKSYGDLGEMVVAINGVKPGSDEFWAFYVNGKSSNVGASTYITKNSDKLEWKLEKIQY